MALYTLEDAKNELKTEIETYGATIESLEDRLGEYVDTALPIYYNEIIQEWQAMPSEYDGRGAEEFGAPDKPTVYSLMTNDLYAYYWDTYQDALGELREESEGEKE